ncbi:MAG: hypothetical protein K8J08_06955 [Thermoanaerobaculia bacterium]|nr:hypothetical protein [Thermoanaerobaculia bacterium]
MNFWKREWFFWGVALLALGGAGGAVWLSQNPDAGWVQDAEGWPLLGPLAREFRDRYVGRAEREVRPEGRRGGDGARGDAAIPKSEPSVEAQEPHFGARPRVWLTERTILRKAPEDGASELVELEPVVSLAEVARQGDWYGLDWRGEVGWAFLPNYSEVSDPPLGSGIQPLSPVADLPPDAERLAAARARLRDGGRELRLGPYLFLTDGPDIRRLTRLDGVVPDLERIYTERFGVQPIGSAKAAIVLFSTKENYLAYKALDPELQGRPSSGHVGKGIVALFLEGQKTDEVRSTVIHELVHLLNRRAIGPALPPWLDEGMAEDLSGSAVGDDGRLVPGSVDATVEVDATGWSASGAMADLIRLRRVAVASGLPSLESLVTLDRDFHRRGAQETHYAMAGFLVRWLLDSYPQAFRGYLAGVAEGGVADGEGLRRRLGRNWADLGAEFEAWLLAQTPSVPPPPSE